MRGRATRSAFALSSAALLVLGVAGCNQSKPAEEQAQGNLKIVEQIQIDQDGKEIKSDTSAKPAAREKSDPAQAAPVRPKPRPRVMMSIVGYMLKPGESREEDIVVSKLYDLSKPGQYTISASRRLSDITTDPHSKLAARSNRLTITVIK